ncbi:lamin tail domain-containing protein [Puniceicoccaceae bacterium K14]|nr:lamin tail domain-containing protein [Puniceicoccaceae bacterium K14]
MFFREEYGEGKLDFPLFEGEGASRFDKIDLRTAQNYSWALDGDSKNTFLRDVFARDTAAAMGQQSPRSRYYHLYLNGSYWGLFMTEERPVATFGESYFGGDKDDYDAIKVQSWTDADAYSIEVTDGTIDAYERLYNAAMNGFEENEDYFSVLGLNLRGERDASSEKLLDVDNMIDYLLVIYYTAASDNGITRFAGGYEKLNNLYAIYNRVNPDGFKWFQHDCEHSLDTNRDLDLTGPFQHENFTLLKYFNAQTLHEKLSINEEYRIRFADRVFKHMYNGGALVRENCEARFDSRAAQIDRAIVANSARWGNTQLDRDTWVDAASTARDFFARNGDRGSEVIGYLKRDGLIPSIDPPSISTNGGEVANGANVSLSASVETIYYTVDGTDPRAVGGGIRGSLYTGVFTIDGPTHLKARARTSNGEWSALAESMYGAPEIPVAITELMYHAPEGDSYDFIEIQNVSLDIISLAGYKFDNAIEFEFSDASKTSLAPGDYLVVVDDIDAFKTAYPTNGVNIAGEFSGDLSNGGEMVELKYDGVDLITFSYDDASNWPQAADGAGHSLVSLHSTIYSQGQGALDYGGNWRSSTFLKGSPGLENPSRLSSVIINEVIANANSSEAVNDQIELHNPTLLDVDVSGWSLSDDRDSLDLFVISEGVTIEAGGYLVFDEDDFNSDQASGFGLSKAGEQVYLSNPSQGVIDSVQFKGQENGVSWGRYPDGGEKWIATQPTLGEGNVPFDFPFQISELMYNPSLSAGSEMEYIVIENILGATASLENEVGSYRIDGEVEFLFQGGISLEANEKIRIVSFDPTDASQRSAFQLKYGLDDTDRLFGPYEGELSNRGGRVALERPLNAGNTLDSDEISWVVVDELFYFDQYPWPASADGKGKPLVRVSPVKWEASSDFDFDRDGIEDIWELGFFDNLEQPIFDMDGDSWSNYEEYIASTDPTDAGSFFQLENLTGAKIQWVSAPNRIYSVYWTDDLNNPFTLVATGLTEGIFVDVERSGSSFYKIKVELSKED